MKRFRIAQAATLVVALVLLGGLACGQAGAEERREQRDRREAGPERGRHEGRDFYRSPHMVYDNRYHHGRYYPAPGYSVSVLPPGNIGISFGRGRFFFHGGVWYRPGPGGYIVARPPAGIVVPVLPLGYSTLWLGTMPYYYANDVYYSAAPGGYAVVEPPDVPSTPSIQPPASETPPPGPASSVPPQAPGTWYYCESAKAYYPYVAECREGWRPVAATPPGAK